jgi:ribosomal protein S27E
MTNADFNRLPCREKWDNYKKMRSKWYCPRCRQQTDVPRRSSPFHGAVIYCGNCSQMLTRRTGGGQLDPFLWHCGRPQVDHTFKPRYGWAWLTKLGLCNWATARKAQLVDPPAQEAKPVRVVIIPVTQYRNLVRSAARARES